MIEKETADVITLILIAIVALELVTIIGLGIWRRLYLQRFSSGSTQGTSRSALSASQQSPSGNLRDTTAAPLHYQSSDMVRNQRDKK